MFLTSSDAFRIFVKTTIAEVLGAYDGKCLGTEEECDAIAEAIVSALEEKVLKR